MPARDLKRTEISAEASAGIYLHVPYCTALCSYCDFYRQASPEGVPGGFADLLLAEASLYAETPPVRIDSLYLGGGTPSLLSDPDLERLLTGLSDRYAIAADTEVTLEANPETFTSERVRRWSEMGINRLSIGVQSFHPDHLRLLGRRAGAERSARAAAMASSSGISNLSVDLMIGIPGQKEEDVGEAVRCIAGLPVTHVSCYLLDLHGGTPLHDAFLEGRVRLPGEESVARFYELLHEGLEGQGFIHYEISNYAKPGYACRHNLKYWTGGDYIGLGPSAHGRFRGWITRNPSSVELWAEPLEKGEFPFEDRHPVSAKMRAEDALIFGLRLSRGVASDRLEEIQHELGVNLTDKVRPLVEAGYAELDEESLRLTPAGFLVSNEVIGYLLPDTFRARGDHRQDTQQ